LGFIKILEAYKKDVCKNIKDQLNSLIKTDYKKHNVNNILSIVAGMTLDTDSENELSQMFEQVYTSGVKESISDFDLDVSFDDNSDVFHDAAQDYAQQRTADLVTQLSNSTKNMLRSDLDQYMKDGLTPQQIANKIGDDYAFSDARALCIARTETGFAWNHAGIQTYKTGGSKGVKVYDGDSDGACADANGQNWSFSYAEAHLLEHQNCVRSFGPMPDDEDFDQGSDDDSENLEGNDTNNQNSDIIKERNMYNVNSNGKRNEGTLTDEQIKEAKDFAISLGMPEDRIYYNEYDCTAYGMNFDLLRIGTDVYPNNNRSNIPNSNISMKGAIAHEVVGHREAALKGLTQENDILEESQASIRAARFTPGLSKIERADLIRDGLMRLKNNGYKLKEVKNLLNIEER
jgi:hypothetical protein